MNNPFEHEYTVCWRRKGDRVDYQPNTANAVTRWLGRDPQASRRLPCGCVGTCDSRAHDTAWNWDGTPDGNYDHLLGHFAIVPSDKDGPIPGPVFGLGETRDDAWSAYHFWRRERNMPELPTTCVRVTPESYALVEAGDVYAWEEE